MSVCLLLHGEHNREVLANSYKSLHPYSYSTLYLNTAIDRVIMFGINQHNLVHYHFFYLIVLIFYTHTPNRKNDPCYTRSSFDTQDSPP